MSNTISPVGPLASYTGSYTLGASTLAVNPATVGDVLVLVTNVGSTSHHATGVSGGGVTTWQHVVGPLVTFSASVDLWVGVVATPGPSTITAAGPLAGFVNQFVAQEFAGGPTWAVTSASSQANAKGSTIKWPTLVAGANELYVGFGVSPLGGVAGSQTAGYTMDSISGCLFLFDPSVSGSQSPTCADVSASPSWTLGALLSAS